MSNDTQRNVIQSSHILNCHLDKWALSIELYDE